MLEDAMSAQVHELHAARRREAEVYRQMIDAAPLRFRRRSLDDTRRSVAKALIRLAGAIAP
jgi:hypothetical protein